MKNCRMILPENCRRFCRRIAGELPENCRRIVGELPENYRRIVGVLAGELSECCRGRTARTEHARGDVNRATPELSASSTLSVRLMSWLMLLY